MGHRDKPKKSHQTRRSSTASTTSTGWSPWEYDYTRRCYAAFKAGRHGNTKFKYSEECDPPEAPSNGLEEGMGQMSVSQTEPAPEGDGVAAQGDHTLPSSSSNETPQLQLPTASYTVSLGSMANPQQLSRGFSSRTGQIQTATWHNPTHGVAGDIYQDVATQPNGTGAQPTSHYNATDAPPTGPRNGSQRNQARQKHRRYTSGSVVKKEETRLDVLPEDSQLSKDFKTAHSKDFKELRVFKVVWTEPSNDPGAGKRKNSDFSRIHDTKYGEHGYTSTRRFVVVRNHEGHALCLPILTYGGQGTTKPGVKPAHHAIIFNESQSASPPRSISYPPVEVHGEAALPNGPICVDMIRPQYQLDMMSRINYAKVYTVEHNIKVCFLGRIHMESRAEFEAAYNRVQTESNSPSQYGDDDDMYGGNGGGGSGGNIHPNNAQFGY